MSQQQARKHRIDRVRFILQTEAGLAKEVQKRCSDIFHQQMRAKLTEVLSRYDSLQIDTLTLDIGHISWKTFDTYLLERVLKQLAQQLSKFAAVTLSTRPEVDSVSIYESLVSQNLANFQSQGTTTAREFYQSLERPLIDRPETFVGDLSAVSWEFDRQSSSFDASKISVAADPLASQFETYLHSDQLAKPQWLGADDWLLAKLRENANTWQSVLARCCVQHRTLQRLLQLYSPNTLRSISHVLSGSRAQLAQSDRDTPAPYLILGALRFFQCHPALVMPVADGVLRADSVQPELALWLAPLQTEPPTPILQQWLRPLLHQPQLRSQLQQHLPGPLINTLQTLLEAKPLASQPFKSTMQRVATPIPAASPDAPLAVSNAGLALLWPLLPSLLTRLGLLQKNAFIDHEAQINAVCWLDWLIWDDEAGTVERTPLTRYLCGLPVDRPIDLRRNPSAEQKAEMAQWLNALPQQLPGLERCSANDLRHLFLQRPGQLLQQKSRWILQVEPDASDVLLRHLPWPVDQILLPWLEYPLAVIWSLKGML